MAGCRGETKGSEPGVRPEEGEQGAWSQGWGQRMVLGSVFYNFTGTLFFGILLPHVFKGIS